MCWTRLAGCPGGRHCRPLTTSQPRHQRRRGLLRSQPEKWLALEHGQGLPAPHLLHGRPNFELWTSAQVAKLTIETQPDGRADAPACRLDRRGWSRPRPVKKSSRAPAASVRRKSRQPRASDLAALRQHGIAVVSDLPGVGQLQGPPADPRGVQGRTCPRSPWPLLWGKVRIGPGIRADAQRAYEHGAVTTRRLHAQHPDQPYPNIQYHAAAVAECLWRAAALPGLHGQRQPTPPSRGIGADPQRPVWRTHRPLRPQLPGARRKTKVAADRCAREWRIVAQPGGKVPAGRIGYGKFQTGRRAGRLAGDFRSTIFHPVGTTKNGRDDDPIMVLDAQLRGARRQGRVDSGLRAVDAGAMPTITSAWQHQLTHTDDGIKAVEDGSARRGGLSSQRMPPA